MKVHKVKCAQCADGVTVVTGISNDGMDGPYHYVFAGKLDNNVATLLACAAIAREKTGEKGTFKLEEILFAFEFGIFHTNVLPSSQS